MKIKNIEIENNWLFLSIMTIIYIILSITNPTIFNTSMSFFTTTLYQVIPTLFIIFSLIFVFNLILDTKNIVKWLGHLNKKRGWAISIFAGILSHGPIYMWYPLLSDLKEKGMRSGLIATFLYNRAIKIPLLPIMIYYFSLKFTILLTFFMILFSIINGILIDKIVGDIK